MADMDTEVKPEQKNDSNDAEMGEEANGGEMGDSSRGKYRSMQGSNEDKKIFVGGISYETTNEDLLAYFGKFGEVTQAQVKYDQLTGRSRGFAFVEFVAAQSVLDVLKEKNREIKGKTVEVKPAKSRENKKIFVGGLPSDYPEDELKAHFEVYGKVDDVEWPWDRSRGLRRNFAFVVFEEESAADKASEQNKQKFGDRVCDVKKAVPQPKRAMMGMQMGRGMGGPPRGGVGRGRGQWGAGYGGWAGQGYGGGGWGAGGGDWYGSGGYGAGYGGYGGTGGGYGGGYGGGGGDYDYTANDTYNNYWGGWGQYGSGAGGAGNGAAASGYETYSQASQGGAAAGAAARGGRYQPY